MRSPTAAKPGPKPKPRDQVKRARVDLRALESDVQAWDTAARDAGMSRNAWLAAAANMFLANKSMFILVGI